MPRERRKISKLNLYHIVLRGIDHQIIFHEPNDYYSFLGVLQYYKEQSKYKLHAYCLMSNHVHLLLEPGEEELAMTMKRIEVKFARWYNLKYERKGYLFQNRFKSEPIENERYMLTVFRYIHQNPYKAGIEKCVGDYPWSSFYYYWKNNDDWIDCDKVLSLFDSVDSCVSFLRTPAQENCLENYPSKLIPDEEANRIMEMVTGCKSLVEFQRLDAMNQKVAFSELVTRGISVRQLNRITGVSRGAITRAIGNRKCIMPCK